VQDKFRQWLIQRGNPSAATYYQNAINNISSHYSEKTGSDINIYTITDQSLISSIAHDYKQDGRFSAYGYEQHGRYRAAMSRYSEFFVIQAAGDLLGIQDSQEIEIFDKVQESEKINFAYERDLQTTLCAQISELFPNYKIFGNNNQGIEYSIRGRRVDVLLEHIKNKSLLVVELKPGVADFKVFGQISMYLGLLQEEFPGIEISGVIVAGSIHESLQQACLITDKITLKIYRMSLELENASQKTRVARASPHY